MSATGKQSASIARLRKKAIKARRSLSTATRDAASVTIADHVIRSHEFAAAKSIACYLPMPDEVDPRRIISRAWRAKKRIFAPVVDLRGEMTFRQLTPDTPMYLNQYGIWEPLVGVKISARDLDIVVTPLVAFDAACNRIGMGGGYFDRCFAFLRHRRHWRKPKLIGVAFDCQKVEKIAANPWDIRLYRVFSETR